MTRLGLTGLLLAGGLMATAATAAADPASVSSRCALLAMEMAADPYEFEMMDRLCLVLGMGEATAAAPEAPPQNYLVKCRVASDPDYIAFRLLTRGQCEQAQGVAE